MQKSPAKLYRVVFLSAFAVLAGSYLSVAFSCPYSESEAMSGSAQGTPTTIVRTSGSSLVQFAALSSVASSGQEAKGQIVRLEGTLETGIVAIGGETTGTVLRLNNGQTVELEFVSEGRRTQAEMLSGERVLVAGFLRVVQGVEIRERRIVRVASLRAARL